MKKVIRLTENDLHRIVKNSVNRILKETNGVPEDLSVASKRYNEHCIDSLYEKTDWILEDYNISLMQFDNAFKSDDEFGFAYLDVDYILEHSGLRFSNSEYNSLCSELYKIGWRDSDSSEGIMEFNVPNNNIDTEANRQKQIDRAALQPTMGDIYPNYNKRPGNNNDNDSGYLIRNNGKQFGYDDYDDEFGMSDEQLYGKTNWRNLVRVGK